MKRITLKEAGKRALTDKQFFDDLVRDVDETLSRENLQLDESDLNALKTALKEPTPDGFELKTFIERVHAAGGKNPFSGWDADWGRSWVPPGWPPYHR